MKSINRQFPLLLLSLPLLSLGACKDKPSAVETVSTTSKVPEPKGETETLSFECPTRYIRERVFGVLITLGCGENIGFRSKAASVRGFYVKPNYSDADISYASDMIMPELSYNYDSIRLPRGYSNKLDVIISIPEGIGWK